MNMETFTPEQKNIADWEQEILDRGKKLGYSEKEMKDDIQEVKRFQEDMNKEKNTKERLNRSLALESFIIEKMNKWDIKAEMNEDEEIIAATNKFDDYKNKGDIYIYDEEKEVMLTIDATTAEQYEKIDKKIDSIIDGIDSEPQDYEKLDYYKKNGDKNSYKKLGHLKYPNPELLAKVNEESIKKIPSKNIPRVIVNITRQTLIDYKKREKLLKKKKGYNEVISLESFETENQVKWEIFRQIKKELLEQSLRLLNKTLTFLAIKTNSETSKINLKEEDKNNLINLQKKFVENFDKYQLKEIDFPYQEISNIKESTERFSKETTKEMEKIHDMNGLEILEDKIEKLKAIFKAYKKYNLIYEKILELKGKILEEDLEKGLDSDYRKFDDIDYQRNNNLNENFSDKNGNYFTGNPIYDNFSLLK
jgi:hypothetical protein